MGKPKDLKNEDFKILYPMDKRGQIIEVAGIAFIIGIAIVGTIGAYLHKESIFVADNISMNLYKYSECKEVINMLDKNTIKVYDTQQKAESDGFHLVRCG